MKTLILGLMVLMGCAHVAQGGDSGPVTAPSVDLNRYVGKWYEVASIPQSFQAQCARNTTAEYALLENGQVRVVNSCETSSGDISRAEGRAKVKDKKSNSKLKVTFVKIFDWIFAFGGSYWILDVDDQYQIALIGDPSRKYAWILTRSPVVSREVLMQAERHYKAQGFDTCAILTSVQTGGFTERTPLCKL